MLGQRLLLPSHVEGGRRRRITNGQDPDAHRVAMGQHRRRSRRRNRRTTSHQRMNSPLHLISRLVPRQRIGVSPRRRFTRRRSQRSARSQVVLNIRGVFRGVRVVRRTRRSGRQGSGRVLRYLQVYFHVVIVLVLNGGGEFMNVPRYLSGRRRRRHRLRTNSVGPRLNDYVVLVFRRRERRGLVHHLVRGPNGPWSRSQRQMSRRLFRRRRANFLTRPKCRVQRRGRRYRRQDGRVTSGSVLRLVTKRVGPTCRPQHAFVRPQTDSRRRCCRCSVRRCVRRLSHHGTGHLPLVPRRDGQGAARNVRHRGPHRRPGVFEIHAVSRGIASQHRHARRGRRGRSKDRYRARRHHHVCPRQRLSLLLIRGPRGTNLRPVHRCRRRRNYPNVRVHRGPRVTLNDRCAHMRQGRRPIRRFPSGTTSAVGYNLSYRALRSSYRGLGAVSG